MSEKQQSAVDAIDLLTIRQNLRGSCGSCGIYEFLGLYQITGVEYAGAILKAVRVGQPEHWSFYVMCASSPIQTEKICDWMVAAGWEIIKTFKQAHNDGIMTLWGAQC